MIGIIYCTIIIGLIEGFMREQYRDQIFKKNYLIASSLLIFINSQKKEAIKEYEITSAIAITGLYASFFCLSFIINISAYGISYVTSKFLRQFIQYV
jgi:hypothetical protein